jgi:hypothetical protein
MLIGIMSPELSCDSCGEPFEVLPYREDTARFCSNQCRANWQSESFKGENGPGWKGGKETFECDWCGVEFEEWPSQSTDFCSPECVHEWLSEERFANGNAPNSGREFGEEHARKLSEAKTGTEPTEEMLEGLRIGWEQEEVWDEMECMGCGETVEVKPWKDKKFCTHDCYAEYVSENGHLKDWDYDEVKHRERDWIIELGHFVDSTWEIDIAFLLKEIVGDYQHEPRFNFDDGSTYYPDFQTDSTVIEVKGYVDDRAMHHAERFIDEYSEYRYIVIGSEMPADIHIPYQKRELLKKVL